MTDNANTDDPALIDFIATVSKGGHVLDLGCGPGAAAAKMAQAGLKVTATDAVPEMIALATQHAGVNAICATFDDITGDNIY
jgi:2-polyprenyl-3-methyl-5-hydroxy-6-metoxy-1,4-benzoquinol methylase